MCAREGEKGDREREREREREKEREREREREREGEREMRGEKISIPLVERRERKGRGD